MTDEFIVPDFLATADLKPKFIFPAGVDWAAVSLL